MGVILIYQGLPPGSGLIERVQRGEWHPLGVSQAYYWLQHGALVPGSTIRPAPGERYPYPSDEGEPVWDWCCAAVGQFPELPQRGLDIDKSYRWLPFVLSAKVRKKLRWPKPGPLDPRSWNDPETDFDELAELPFNGAPQIAPGVTGGQGIPIRLMEHGAVNDFSTYVGAMDPDQVEKRIVEYDMRQNSVQRNAEMYAAIFSDFQRFFAQAAARGEHVLVIWE